MGFFYISVFSLIFIAFVYGAALLMFWFIWTKAFGRKFSGPAVWVIAALILVAPWAEEIWIAWTFGQLCKKDAGLFISKTVDVDGFYDDTTHWWRQLAESKYAFVESRDNTFGGLYRVEREGSGLRHFKIDRPTARFQYRMAQSHKPVTHRIKAFEWVIEDIESDFIIAREKAYAREPYWFYIGFDRPTMFCPIFGDSGEKLTGGLYRLVLKPSMLGDAYVNCR